jgi:hypothetical protein
MQETKLFMPNAESPAPSQERIKAQLANLKETVKTQRERIADLEKQLNLSAGNGKKLNLIVNNNGGGKQLDELAITVPEEEMFLVINASYSLGVVDGNPRGADKKRVAVFVDDQTGWDGFALYQWGDVNNLGGGWPGVSVGGEATVNGIATKMFVVDEAFGKAENLIFNNGGNGTQLGDYALKYERNAYYLKVTASGVSVF